MPKKILQRVNAFNAGLAAKITSGVATMWCAYIFAIIALISQPAPLLSQERELLTHGGLSKAEPFIIPYYYYYPGV